MMIKSVTLKNLKSIKNETFIFTPFDLLVGMNNCGKSTILQALAIWQYCVDEFRRNKRSGSRGIQIVLPNFTALPLPEFNLLWTDKLDRQYPQKGEKKKQEFIYIEVFVRWNPPGGKEEEFGVHLRYQSPQSVYATPREGWPKFNELDENKKLPRLVYVPPFSGLEPFEEWRDDSILRKQVGKAQPGSVLRNLLYRVVDRLDTGKTGNAVPLNPRKNKEWKEINQVIKRLFSIDIQPPDYEKGIDTQITCNYKQGKKKFDIIAGGSGFHQMVTILAFMYGYEGVTTLLFDEPDAHMHANLQREMLDFLKRQSEKRNIQFIIATHAEELIKGVEPTKIISVLKTKPGRVETTPRIITALSDVSNLEITWAKASPFILYVEGESDERILRAWAQVLEKEKILNKFYTRPMGGGSKKQMKEEADKHFEGLRQIVPNVKRIMLFDYDSADDAFHPEAKNKTLHEWKRKNIENYLLVKDAWHRAAADPIEYNLFAPKVGEAIDNFFDSENLTLPKKASWKTLNANVFKVVDGKKILFENEDSLFQKLKQVAPGLNFNKETITLHMLESEIHEDVTSFFEKLESIAKE
jgi:hypothetical protein